MIYSEIVSVLNSLNIPESGFSMTTLDGFYWGRGSKAEYAFGFDSRNKTLTPMNQTTKHLKLFLNEKFKVTIDSVTQEKHMSLLILRTIDDKLIELFVKLSQLLSNDTDENKLLKHFLSLKDLFSNEKKASLIELQGMYGELYAMYSLKINYGIDISNFYQKVDKNKFDFSITQTKKLEIKSTLKPVRIHHFLHQQLDVDRYDIYIVSLMLQKDDCGMSLLDLINECKDVFSNNLGLIFHIENMVKNIDVSDLDSIRFNLTYSKENMKFYHANDVPKINEKNIEGVFNIDYDVDFSNTSSVLTGSFIDWLKND